MRENNKSNSKFDGLPLDDPRVIQWAIQDLDCRVTKFETTKAEATDTEEVEIPTPLLILKQLPWQVQVIIVAAALYLFPEKATKLLLLIGL
jgi:hypothetical protein